MTAESPSTTDTGHWRAQFCTVHHVGPGTDICTDCRVWAIQSAAEHLRDLAEGGELRDLAAAAHDGTVPEGTRIPTTLTEAAAELFAFAAAVKSGDIS